MSKKLRIVVSSKSYYPILGGSIVFAAMLARSFSAAGHEVRVITRTAGQPMDDEPYQLTRQPSFKDLWELADWADVLLQVDASWRDALPFLARGVPWFPTIHRGKVPYSKLDFKGVLLLAFESAGYRIGRAIAVADYVVKSWRLNAVAIPNPFDPDCFHPPTEDEPRDIDVIFVGRICPEKGVFILLDALAVIQKSHPELIKKVAIVGNGMEAELRKAAGSLSGIEFHFPGMLGRKAVGDWMRRSKLLAFPTTPEWLEASPLTPLEALACGCKVVASNIGGTKENISPESRLVEPGNTLQLARAIQEELVKGDTLSSESTQRFLEGRRLEQVSRRYLDRFEAAISRRQRSSKLSTP